MREHPALPKAILAQWEVDALPFETTTLGQANPRTVNNTVKIIDC
jgi:hypothetical protein